MVEYEKAIKRPFQDIKKLLIGSIIAIIPIANFIYSGYLLKAAENTMKKDNNLPEWEDWGNLFMAGIMAAIISFIYFIPAGIITIVAGTKIISALLAINKAAMSSLDSSIGSWMIVFFLVMGITFLVLPMALLRFVDKGKFSAAFAFGDILKKVFRGKYIIAWIIVGVYSIILMAILSIIPVAGTMIAAFITGITSITIFAEVYSEE